MVNTAPETPTHTTVKFDSLALLREELSKQSHNAERLDEFQKTIDEAIEKGDREGIIEFTEDEWKSLITNEDLPPMEQVKALLENKIAGMQEVQTESREQREGIMGELDEKVEEAKEAVEEVKDKATGAVEEALSPIQKIKASFAKIGGSISEVWNNLWTPVKFAWYTLWASLGFKFGKDALAAMTKEKAEEAVEKAKEQVTGSPKEGDEKPEEGKEGVIEKAAPIAILGGAGLGILNFIRNKLPTSITEKLGDPSDKAGFLKKLAGNRALKLFGIGGITLFGIGKLSEALQDPAIAAELGEMPESPEEAKKEWWRKAIEKAGIGIKDGAEEIWSLVNGEKLDDYLTSRENADDMDRRGYVTLEEHPSIIGAKRQLGLFQQQCEVFYNENQQAFNAIVGASILLKPGAIVGAGAKSAAITLSMLKFAAPGTLIPAGIVLALLGNTIEGIKHIQVPKELGPEDLKDLLEIPDIKKFLEEQVPGITENIHFETVSKELQTLEQKIKDFNTKEFWDKIAGSAAEKIIESPQEKINTTNKQGIDTFISDLELLEKKQEKPGIYKTLLGDTENPGVLRDIVAKVGAGNALTEGDIRTMMEATEGTNIRIFPRENTKSGTTIQWQTVDEHGTIQGAPRNICVNPTIDHPSQYEAARDFVVNEYNLSAMNVVGKVGGGFREIFSELTESIQNNHEKSGSLIEALMRDGGSILTIGAETFAVDYLGNKYLLGPWNIVQGAFMGIDTPEDKLEMQEGLVEYGQGLAPVILITAIKRGIQKKPMGFLFGRLLLESVTYPIHIVKGAAKGSIIGGKYIYERIFAGDYKAVFSDPKNQFNAYFRENLHKFKWLQNALPGDTARKIRGHHTNISKLEEARKLLYDAKQSSFGRSKKVEDAIKILENESDSFEKLVGSRNVDNDSIRNILDRLEKEIEEQKKLLSILENGVRERFPQTLENRAANVESLKGFDIKTEQGRKDAEKMLLDSQGEIENMEKERLRMENEYTDAKKKFDANPNNTSLKQDYEAKRSTYNTMIGKYAENHRNLSEIREAMGELLHGRKPRIRIGESHLRSVKGLRGSAKILGILAVTVGAGVAIEKIAGAVHGDSSEIDKGELHTTTEDDDKYYGFRKENETAVNENKETNEYTCESPEEFDKRIVAIETQYTEAISKFFDPEFINNLSAEEREKKIQEAADGHMIRVDTMKSLIRANKDMMEAYWNKKFTTEGKGEEVVPEEIREQGVKAFMFIHRKDGKLTLDYMNHQEMKNVFYTLYDAAHTGFLEGTLGEKGGMAADLALRVAPFTGSFMDGADAYEHFSRGNVGDGIISSAWCLGGLVLDVGGFFSFGGSTAAGVALRTGKAGVRIAQTTGKALLHNGVQLGTQFGMKLAEIPRSESVSIESL